MRAIWILTCLPLIADPADAVVGDLNEDGVVDFADFFIFADQFGKEGPVDSVVADTVVVAVRDTLERIVEREITVRDTVIVTVRDTLERIIEREVVVRDTLERIIEREVAVRDTVELVREVTVRDTVVQFLVDTVYTNSETVRPPLQSSWTGIISDIERSVYWLGVTARPEGSTRFDLTFIGTGFAVNDAQIATNYHVGVAIDNLFKNVRSDLTPRAIAVRAGTQVFGSETYYLGTVSDNRDLLGFWDERYDSTTNSPDIAIFSASTWSDEGSVFNLRPVEIVSLDNAQDLAVGEEVGILGFPGVLETNHNPFTLAPIATFKSGTISAFRAYDASKALTSAFSTALLGKIIQHNLETAPGNSGSPIFNKRGEIIGIHNAGLAASEGDAFDFGIRADEIRIALKAIFRANSYLVPNAKPIVAGGFIQPKKSRR